MLWEYKWTPLPQTARRMGCGTLGRLRRQSWEGPAVTREGKTPEARPHEAKRRRSCRIGAWARRSGEAGVMSVEQRSPGCSSDERIRSRSLNRGVLSSWKSDRAVANRERGKAVFVEGGGRNLHLEPDRGNLAVRDFRGGDGNVCELWAPTRRRLIDNAQACGCKTSRIGQSFVRRAIFLSRL